MGLYPQGVAAEAITGTAGSVAAPGRRSSARPISRACFNADQELRSQRYSVENGWAPTHDTLDVGATSEQALALDPAGNGFVVGVTPSGEVRAARFRAASGWQPSVLLGTLPTTTYAAQPKIVLDYQGRGAAIWRSDLDLMIRRFSE